jgi:hypothetical protein
MKIYLILIIEQSGTIVHNMPLAYKFFTNGVEKILGSIVMQYSLH